jgi:hypothetical protein
LTHISSAGHQVLVCRQSGRRPLHPFDRCNTCNERWWHRLGHTRCEARKARKEGALESHNSERLPARALHACPAALPCRLALRDRPARRELVEPWGCWEGEQAPPRRLNVMPVRTLADSASTSLLCSACSAEHCPLASRICGCSTPRHTGTR